MSEGAIDFLNRDKEVDQIINIIESIDKSRKGYTFSINGNWGIGKSFFLDLLEEKLSPEYTVIRYNCWKNDYYKEPLEAILMVVAENINRLINRNHENIGRQMVANYFDCAKYIGLTLSEQKTGINLKKVKKLLYKDNITYDDSMPLISNLLNAISKYLDELTKEYKIIIMVDELDRCIPEYAIKVLERLHHIFEGKNIIVILAVDKNQLVHTVENIFGKDTDVDDYLKKFINFQTELSDGVLNTSINKTYEKYLSNFSATKFAKEFDDYFYMLLNDIPARDKKAIFEKSQLIHTLSNLNDKEYDLSVAAFEITIVLCLNYLKFDNVFKMLSYREMDKIPMEKNITYKFPKILDSTTVKEYDNKRTLINYDVNLYSRILLYLHILEYDKTYLNPEFQVRYQCIEEYYECVRPIVTKIYDLAKIIK